VRKCPVEAKSQIQKIYDLVKVCICYDPNFNDTGDEDMQNNDDQEEGWGSDYYNEDIDDDDDTAWKVRKSSVKVLEAAIISCSSCLYEGQLWAKFA
jgi:hypothetical protein